MMYIVHSNCSQNFYIGWREKNNAMCTLCTMQMCRSFVFLFLLCTWHFNKKISCIHFISFPYPNQTQTKIWEKVRKSYKKTHTPKNERYRNNSTYWSLDYCLNMLLTYAWTYTSIFVTSDFFLILFFNCRPQKIVTLLQFN